MKDFGNVAAIILIALFSNPLDLVQPASNLDTVETKQHRATLYTSFESWAHPLSDYAKSPLLKCRTISSWSNNATTLILQILTFYFSTGNFSCLEVIFTLRRRLGYYLFHTYIPTCLIVVMSWISFWIKPEAVPARITLSVTSLLTLSTQHAQSQKSLPPVSYVKVSPYFFPRMIDYAYNKRIHPSVISLLCRRICFSHLISFAMSAK